MDTLTGSGIKEAGLRDRIEAYRAELASDGNEAQTRFHVIDAFLT